jgi:hypothetical protein
MREITMESNLSLQRPAAQEEATNFILRELSGSYVAKTLNRLVNCRPSCHFHQHGKQIEAKSRRWLCGELWFKFVLFNDTISAGDTTEHSKIK